MRREKSWTWRALLPYLGIESPLSSAWLYITRGPRRFCDRCAHHLDAVLALFPKTAVMKRVKQTTLDELVSERVSLLTAYQNAAYAQRYRAWVNQVQKVEAAWGKSSLSEAVARHLFKVMAYKDEYEVARLYTNGQFEEKLAAQFEGHYQLRFHLAPPLWASQT